MKANVIIEYAITEHVRVFVDVDRKPPEVITVYRTGRIEKYWRQVR
ncbi:MAG TPA: hypothetical protein VEF34_15740 [Syntrophobacteraceae bacterium]|nr:hypothetical protein [Syntrophobacteraceae bacterium]